MTDQMNLGKLTRLMVMIGVVMAAGIATGSPSEAPQDPKEQTHPAAEAETPMTTTQTYELYIAATPQEIWDAITTSAWTTRYGYRGPVDYDLEPDGAFRAHATPAMKSMGMPEVVVDGEVVEVDAPTRLVQTYRFLFNEDTRAEGFTRLTWEIEDTGAGFSRLTLTHDLDGAPIMAGMVGSPFSQMGTGGWSWILSDLKTVLETGKALGETEAPGG